MTPQIDNQLVQVYYKEALQKAAQSRAERNSQPGLGKIKVGETLFALAAAGVPVVIWLLLVLNAK